MKRIVALLGSFVMLAYCVAEIVPTPGTQRIAPVFKQADLVCNCVVQSIRMEGEQPTAVNGSTSTQHRVVATLLVTDFFKSEGTGQTSLTVTYDDDVSSVRSYLSGRAGQSVLCFLVRKPDGNYEFADRWIGSTDFSAIPVSKEPANMDKLQSVLGSIVLQSLVTQDRISAARLLQGFDVLRADTCVELDEASKAKDPEVALAALAALLRNHSADSVSKLVNFLQSYTGDESPLAFQSVGSELGNVRDPKAEVGLELLTASPFSNIRCSAIDAMRHIKSKHGAATLVEKLSDADPTVRYLAVISLAELFKAPDEYSPTMNVFEQEPDRYISLWKDWWTRSGLSIVKQYGSNN